MSAFILQVKLMCSYCKNHGDTEVPDPYYGGPQGFEKVIYEIIHLISHEEQLIKSFRYLGA